MNSKTAAFSTATIEPFVDEVKTYTGGHSARATLAGTPDAPAVALVVGAEQESPQAESRQTELGGRQGARSTDERGCHRDSRAPRGQGSGHVPW